MDSYLFRESSSYDSLDAQRQAIDNGYWRERSSMYSKNGNLSGA
jgi:hypothetical protein